MALTDAERALAVLVARVAELERADMFTRMHLVAPAVAAALALSAALVTETKSLREDLNAARAARLD